MKKCLKYILLILLTIILQLTAIAQPPERYSYLRFPATIIAKKNLPNFYRFVFNFKLVGNEYLLNGVALDAQGRKLYGPFDLPTYSPPPFKPLKNIIRGIISLEKTLMDSNGMDGTFDCFLKPHKYKEGTPEADHYVSYLVQDFKDTIRKKTKKNQLIRDFEMNPSPPR